MYYRRELPVSSGVYRPLATRRYVMMTMGGFWPVLQALPDGRLGVVTRDGDFHIGERGRLVWVTSPDGGESWSHASVISADGPDNRNPAFGVTAGGALLVCFIKADNYANGNYDQNRECGGCTPLYISRSDDGGATWSKGALLEGQGRELLSGAVMNGPDRPQRYYSPFGKMVTLPDGTVIMGYYVSQGEGPGRSAAFVTRSRDDGRTWVDTVAIAEDCGEAAICHLGEGRLIAMLRRERLYQADSDDGGYTWSEPHPVTDEMEFPGDVIKLRDGRLLLTYGRREPPYGIQGMISHDEGKTWDTDNRLLLVGDSGTHDCGYPSSVQREDGVIVTVYYASDVISEQYNRRRMGFHGAAILYRPEDLP